MIGGLKATISNPNTSTEAKEHAAERLEELGQPRYTSPSREHTHELGTHQIAGYKATISSSWDSLYLVSCYLKLEHLSTDPNTSDEAKEHAREVLKAEGEEIPQPGHPPPASTQDPHTKRVLAGYKAAIHSTSKGLLPPTTRHAQPFPGYLTPIHWQIRMCPSKPSRTPRKN